MDSDAINAACNAVNEACGEVNAALAADPQDPERLALAVEKMNEAQATLDQLKESGS